MGSRRKGGIMTTKYRFSLTVLAGLLANGVTPADLRSQDSQERPSIPAAMGVPRRHTGVVCPTCHGSKDTVVRPQQGVPVGVKPLVRIDPNDLLAYVEATTTHPAATPRVQLIAVRHATPPASAVEVKADYEAPDHSISLRVPTGWKASSQDANGATFHVLEHEGGPERILVNSGPTIANS